MSVILEERPVDVALETPSIDRPARSQTSKGVGTRRPAIARRPKPDAWCSTLDPADLARLLSVIEKRLIPTLVAHYTPARCAPLDERR